MLYTSLQMLAGLRGKKLTTEWALERSGPTVPRRLATFIGDTGPQPTPRPRRAWQKRKGSVH